MTARRAKDSLLLQIVFIAKREHMSESAIEVTPREELLIKVRERLSKRLLSIDKEIEIHQNKLEELVNERLELQTELKVVDRQMLDNQMQDGLD
jgi:hypothetical protein